MKPDDLIESLITIKDYIRWASSEFYKHELTFGHGFSQALDEAVYLVLHALHLPWSYPQQYFDCVLTRVERQQVISILQQRIDTRKPAAYLTREAWFCGLEFYVDERVLVPRSPIAELINNRFEPWIDADRVTTIVDVCTGSGCIAIACQYAFPTADVCALDLSSDALEVARINRRKHAMDESLELYQSDLFTRLPMQKFDLIVSNPPYVDALDMHNLSAEFRAEPEMGLAAGDDGLAIVDRLLREAVEYLSDEGLLVVEVGNSQAAMMAKYPRLPVSWIDFEQGGDGVFCVTGADLKQYFTIQE